MVWLYELAPSHLSGEAGFRIETLKVAMNGKKKLWLGGGEKLAMALRTPGLRSIGPNVLVPSNGVGGDQNPYIGM